MTEAVNRLSKMCGENRGMEVDVEVNVVITLCVRQSAAALEFIRRTPRLRGGAEMKKTQAPFRTRLFQLSCQH